MTSPPKFIIAYGVNRYIGLDGLEPKDGYRYVNTPSQAMTFSSANLLMDFMDTSGPGWVRDLTKKGLLKPMRLVDGIAEAM